MVLSVHLQVINSLLPLTAIDIIHVSVVNSSGLIITENVCKASKDKPHLKKRGATVYEKTFLKEAPPGMTGAFTLNHTKPRLPR